MPADKKDISVPPQVACDFCGQLRDEVAVMVAGPTVFISDPTE
jgi:hypothetical protein